MNLSPSVRCRRLMLVLLAVIPVITAGCGFTLFGGDRLYLPDEQAAAVTVHVEVTEDGFKPANVRVPAGPSVQIVLRNRGSDEFHYKVEGLHANQILWLVQSKDMVREEGVSDDDHEEHHRKEFVNFRGTSPGGIKPNLKEVHLYASGKSVDVIHFFALKTGTYQVVDPLHPNLKGTFTVYAP